MSQKNKHASDSTDNQRNRRHFKFEHWNLIALYLVLYDILAVSVSYVGALWLRFDCHAFSIPTEYLESWLKFAPFYAAFCVIVFGCLHLYKSIWRFASYNELSRILIASVITAAFHLAGTLLFIARMPISYYCIGAFAQLFLTVGIRFSYRFILLERAKIAMGRSKQKRTRVMLIGAGAAGQMILRDIQRAHEVSDRVVCIVDDNPNKWNRFIDGIRVVGGRESISQNVTKYKVDKIYYAIPSADAQEKRDILDICKETGCELKTLPGMYQFVNGEVSLSAMQDVNVEDLLGREPIRVNLDDISSYLNGKTVLVTGGGGSIGSELCRQIAKQSPRRLIIFDIYENNAYDIQQELKETHPELELIVLIGSVRDSRKLNQLFAEYHPEIVYHAAAHKHVPLMEDSPAEAVKNNVIGTYKTAYAAMVHGAERFILISTDKAVNPTNIMGASKRLCEMIIQSFDRLIRDGHADILPDLRLHSGMDYRIVHYDLPEHPHTEYVAVRFGNVLGSNGSVIPLFKNQIAKGGPVTVTHPDIIRYFMTIPEAVSLVLQAGAYANGGEIFVLDMGEPVKIDTLARNLIKLSGLKPDVDIKIVYTGLRPGEKLYEEKLMSEEGLKTTSNKLIHIAHPIPIDVDEFLVQLRSLMNTAYDGGDVRAPVAEMVPTYHYSGQNKTPEDEAAAEPEAETVIVQTAE